MTVRLQTTQKKLYGFDPVEICQTLLSKEGMMLVKSEHSGRATTELFNKAIQDGEWVLG
jgi:hypothetical protein